MKTAVEWIISKLPIINDNDPYLAHLIEQAKEMEKQQQGYSEEEVWNICNELASYFIKGDTFDLQEWFKQFKKK